MTLTIREILEVGTALPILAANCPDARSRYPVSRRIHHLAPDYESAVSTRLAIYKKYGEEIKDKDGQDTGNMKVPAEKLAAFQAELKAFLDTPIEVAPLIGGVKLDLFDHLASATPDGTSQLMSALFPLIEE